MARSRLFTGLDPRAVEMMCAKASAAAREIGERSGLGERIRLTVSGPMQELELHATGVLVQIGYEDEHERVTVRVFHDPCVEGALRVAQRVADMCGVDVEEG